jgi:hypothetical protein
MSIIIIRNDLHRHRVCLQALPFSHSKSGWPDGGECTHSNSALFSTVI